MTTDRLAALLAEHEPTTTGCCCCTGVVAACECGDWDAEYSDGPWETHVAARLAAAGVTVAAQPAEKCKAPLKWEEIAVCSVHGIKCNHD